MRESIVHIDADEDRLVGTPLFPFEGNSRRHMHRWADGSAHLHWWFVARPERRIELYGWGNVLWSQLLPPLPREVLDANLAIVAAALRGA